MMIDNLVTPEEFAFFDNEAKNLEVMAEECAELIQVKSKVCRFGWDSCHPDGGPTNRELMEQEAGDVIAMIDILMENGTLNKTNVARAARNKIYKLAKFY